MLQWFNRQNLYHPVVLVLPLIVGTALVSRSWAVLIMGVGVELYSFSFHSREHHLATRLAKPAYTFIGATIALTGAFLLYQQLHQIR